ncbi:T9SS type A sorting domain-containing protein [candidate division WOR-3 bacterium]|uniref:T9SS type A sorting domain-containing protein n=1 Tax=candidate division WOR-3 bacterium TaxID=2052148 RepID=A0A937XGY9_UNCW3|nr:T9SS type A sorting domain-containing protein [candidate division WOR-3 bacterium]
MVSPNPVGTQATIGYSLPRGSSVSCAVYDVAGNLVSRLAAGSRVAGEHQTMWNAAGVKPGVYFCKLVAGGSSHTARLAVVR